jgi:hypothetical protein
MYCTVMLHWPRMTMTAIRTHSATMPVSAVYTSRVVQSLVRAVHLFSNACTVKLAVLNHQRTLHCELC